LASFADPFWLSGDFLGFRNAFKGYIGFHRTFATEKGTVLTRIT